MMGQPSTSRSNWKEASPPATPGGDGSATRDTSQDGQQQPSWNEMYERLRQLKEKTGTANLPQRGFHDPLLQSWINDQRHQCKVARQHLNGSNSENEQAEAIEHTNSNADSSSISNNSNSRIFAGLDAHKLTFERVLELESLGFSWDSPHDVEWKKRYGELKQYKDEHGHCRVPARDKEHPELGRWVMTQRRQYALLKQDRKSRMTQERQRLLEHITFEWVLREDYKEKWNHHIKELRGFVTEYGHFDVVRVLGSESELRKWVTRMKKQYRAYVDGNNNGHNLNKSRFDELRKLGFHSVALPLKGSLAASLSASAASKRNMLHIKKQEEQEQLIFSHNNIGNKRSCHGIHSSEREDQRIAESKLANPQRGRDSFVRGSSVPCIQTTRMAPVRASSAGSYLSSKVYNVVGATTREPTNMDSLIGYSYPPPSKRSKISMMAEVHQAPTRSRCFSDPSYASAHLAVSAPIDNQFPPHVVGRQTINPMVRASEDTTFTRYQTVDAYPVPPTPVAPAPASHEYVTLHCSELQELLALRDQQSRYVVLPQNNSHSEQPRPESCAVPPHHWQSSLQRQAKASVRDLVSVYYGRH